MNELVLVLDFGGLHRELIARKIREFNVYCEILPGNTSIEKICALNPIGIVNCGDPAYDMQSLEIPVLNDLKNLQSFLFDTCKAKGDYKLEDYIETQVMRIRKTVGDKKVLLALSGGVDSSVCAALLSKAIPGQLTCVFVDNGLMRLNEGDDIEAVFKGHELNFVRIDAAERFLSKLKGITEPEKKRKVVGEEFIRVFEDEAKKLGRIPIFAQGTNYADVIESGGDHGELIKSHHNVGGLPDVLDFDFLLEPLSGLFKNEVREVGKMLGLSPTLVDRQPFPGPGLAVRVMGEITFPKLNTLRRADAIVREELDKLDPRPSQYFAVLTDTKSVGVKNGKRTYDPVLAIRAVNTKDFMTAECTRVPFDVLERIAARIADEIVEVSRVVFDISSKPPGTVEWE